MTHREVVARYRGSWVGIFWALLTPILMMLVYWFIFGLVFKVRWDPGMDVGPRFAAILFSGLVVMGLFNDVLTRSPLLVLQNINYVKKIRFPLHILAWVVAGSALFHLLMASLVLLLFQLSTGGTVSHTLIAFPLILLPLLLMCLGLSWFLAGLGVYIRDTQQVVGFIATAMMFLTPVFYPISAVPYPYQKLMLLNPMTFVVEATRNLLFFEKWPDWHDLSVYTVAAIMVFWLGYAWFARLRRSFSDVL
jgi:lipopolysaccharide transport system permease protein